jgi:organic hydroperoxide reductase OsmC/OhrA
MRISATVSNAPTCHRVQIQTEDRPQELLVPAKPSGGSAVNGGEFLMLALATCYCNDLYREAARLGLRLASVEVTASATFEGVGLAARDVRYRASVKSDASEADIKRLLRETDAVAEVHNTIRQGAAVTLELAEDADPPR